VEIRSGVGPVITVIGADLMDGTPIYDIKPYLPYVDSHPEAIGGFSDAHKDDKLEVSCPEELLRLLPSDKQQILKEILAGDPRPAYQNDADRVYGMPFAGFDIHFRVTDKILTVIEITPLE